MNGAGTSASEFVLEPLIKVTPGMSPDSPEVMPAEELKKHFPSKRKANVKPRHEFDND